MCEFFGTTPDQIEKMPAKWWYRYNAYISAKNEARKK